MPRRGYGVRLKRQRQSTLLHRWNTSKLSMDGMEGTYCRPPMNSGLVLEVPNKGAQVSSLVSNGGHDAVAGAQVWMGSALVNY